MKSKLFYNYMKMLFVVSLTLFKMHSDVLQTPHEVHYYNRANENGEVRVLLASIKLGIKEMCSNVNQCNYFHRSCPIVQNTVIFHKMLFMSNVKSLPLILKHKLSKKFQNVSLISESAEC